MNNPALEHPNPVRLKGPSRPRQESLDREEWYIPSDFTLAAAVEIEDEPVSIAFNPEGLIRSLRRWYEFRDYEAVRGFLMERPFLIQLLLHAHKEIREYFDFGRGSDLVLKVIAEPEAQEEQELFLFIQTELPPKAARPLLNVLYREWWLDAMLDAKGEMNISLEYV